MHLCLCLLVSFAFGLYYARLHFNDVTQYWLKIHSNCYYPVQTMFPWIQLSAFLSDISYAWRHMAATLNLSNELLTILSIFSEGPSVCVKTKNFQKNTQENMPLCKVIAKLWLMDSLGYRIEVQVPNWTFIFSQELTAKS